MFYKSISIYIAFFLLQSSFLSAGEFRFGANAFIPPYVIKETPERPGVLLEMAIVTLKAIGLKPKIMLLSNQRINLSFHNNEIDGALFLANYKQRNNDSTVYESDPLLSFKNGFVCVKKDRCKDVMSLDNNYSLVGFQNARIYVDKRFEKLVRERKGPYSEVTNQRNQVLGLYTGEYDIAFMDSRIFEYHLKHLMDNKHPVLKKIDPLDYKSIPWDNQPERLVAFKSKKIRDQFNKKINELKKNGTYKKILKKYNLSH